ncbi:hypothetical protein EON62_06540 [archaeon]|nr:MAG: hypothetical protein EON62_06540 [archaeon]
MSADAGSSMTAVGELTSCSSDADLGVPALLSADSERTGEPRPIHVEATSSSALELAAAAVPNASASMIAHGLVAATSVSSFAARTCKMTGREPKAMRSPYASGTPADCATAAPVGDKRPPLLSASKPVASSPLAAGGLSRTLPPATATPLSMTLALGSTTRRRRRCAGVTGASSGSVSTAGATSTVTQKW